MFIFALTALAATQIGWPCQRLNWGWRNVWSTCSINSFVPVAPTAGLTETAPSIATGFRFSTASLPSYSAGTAVMTGTGNTFVPSAGTVPTLLCQNAANTGSGISASLRNRCRRAIDAYGALVKSCNSAPNIVAPMFRGPNSVSPDYLPQAGHAPHVTNVAGLTANAQMCQLAPGTTGAPNLLSTPANTCPGLLGWFTVVFNACGFTNAPGLQQAASNTLAPQAIAPAQAYTALYFPAGSVSTPNVWGGAFAQAGAAGANYFCSTLAPGAGPQGTPNSWNFGAGSPAGFRTSRCRKALDQFGRTANRCQISGTPASPSLLAGGYTDPLKALAIGTASPWAAATPSGLNTWTPTCN